MKTERTGKCPGCDAEGALGSPCEGHACRKRGYHFIPGTYWERAHASGQAPDPVIGQLVGDFLIVDFIGGGGFGRVYLALQAPLLRLKGALKLIEFPSQNVMLNQALLEKFRGEAEALADLTHPNIVRLLKYGTHGERPYLVMEYVDNARTLRDETYYRARDNESFSIEQLRQIFHQILNGLQAAHSQNIIHRDIKPENVMIQKVAGNPIHVKILDFGTAKIVEDRADTKWPLGSPSYMAPEQIGLKGLGPWSDLYAVGVIAFELLSGHKPFPGENENEIVTKKLDDTYDPFAQIAQLEFPEPTLDFLRKALEREPEDRFRTVSAFRQALDQAIGALHHSNAVAPGGVELTNLIDSRELLELAAANPSPPAEPDETISAEVQTPPPVPADATGEAPGRKVSIVWLGALLGLVVAAVGGFVALDRAAATSESPADTTPNVMAAVPDASVALKAEPDQAPANPTAKPDPSGVRAKQDAGLAEPEDASAPAGITAGKYHTCVRAFGGSARCWGANFDGELGVGHTRPIGDNEPASAASPVVFDQPIAQLVSAGDRQASFNCALLASGDVACWGSNHNGQLGYGHTRAIQDASEAKPLQLGGPVAQIAVGGSQYGSHACVVYRDGKLRCWGSNKFGQLGYGHKTPIGDDEIPTAAPFVDFDDTVTSVAAGKYHTCALLASGEVYCWGYNQNGQLGLGHTRNIGDDEIPKVAGKVSLGAPAHQLALGRAHTCALLEDGQVRCWGWNNKGQLGYGHTRSIGHRAPPADVEPVEVGGKVEHVVAGSLHTCALLEGGRVRCWGDNKFGQLGYAHTRGVGNEAAPATVGDVYLGGAARALAAGAYHNCAILTDDSVRCWGHNKFGQLGHGNTEDVGDNETPAAVDPVAIE